MIKYLLSIYLFLFYRTTTQIKDDITKLNEAFEEVKGEF